MFFISSKKLFSFLRYLNFCILHLPLFFSLSAIALELDPTKRKATQYALFLRPFVNLCLHDQVLMYENTYKYILIFLQQFNTNNLK